MVFNRIKLIACNQLVAMRDTQLFINASLVSPNNENLLKIKTLLPVHE
jgi:hypothetical protein